MGRRFLIPISIFGHLPRAPAVRRRRHSVMRIGAALAMMIIVGMSAGDAFAQLGAADYAKRQKELVRIAGVFGEMHHLRRLCEPRRESEIWRERMKTLVNLESPTSAVRENMVRAFNDGFEKSQNRFRTCRRETENYAAARARDGETIIIGLMAPLVGNDIGDAASADGATNRPIVTRP